MVPRHGIGPLWLHLAVTAHNRVFATCSAELFGDVPLHPRSERREVPTAAGEPLDGGAFWLLGSAKKGDKSFASSVTRRCDDQQGVHCAVSLAEKKTATAWAVEGRRQNSSRAKIEQRNGRHFPRAKNCRHSASSFRPLLLKKRDVFFSLLLILLRNTTCSDSSNSFSYARVEKLLVASSTVSIMAAAHSSTEANRVAFFGVLPKGCANLAQPCRPSVTPLCFRRPVVSCRFDD